MNYSTAIFLINDDVRCVAAVYEDRDDAPRALFKTFDPHIGVDSWVVVPTSTRHGMTVCKIVEVDMEPDYDSTEEMKWIIGVISRVDFDKILQREGEAINQIKSAEKRRKREELRDALVRDAGPDLKALPIYQVGDDAPEPPPPAPDTD